ncbi:MAG: porin family protein [Saprospiraceae bacterium]|nr:porin family protein [Saprospiraceae bacterium]MBK8483349.1 porin family protein [Saprospiraceae bacterium]MBK9220862.1 porin family protein [Saprospiraceae bacterium]MBK9722293.1 porin family protein [Saprospiraceae bacterium]MBK9729315.1 porin family protein [Saprospiraceae bacterium]
MKKQLLILVLFMGLFSVSNYAQGKLFLGVDLGFSSQDNGFNGGHETSEFVIAPSLGYWLSDNMAIVGRVGYASHDNKTDDVKTSGFGIGAELRYGWHLGDNTFLYLAPGARYGSEKTEFAGGDATTTEFQIAIRPGVDYKIADKWSIDAHFGSLGYTSQSPEVGDAVSSFGLDLSMSAISFGIWYHF